MPNLDPDPRNILGKGILGPATEQRLFARGIIYAEKMPTPDGRTILIVCKRLYKDAMFDMGRSLSHARRPVARTLRTVDPQRQQPATQTPIPA